VLTGQLLIAMDETTRRRLRTAGLLLVVVGLAGVVLPRVMGLALSLLIALLLILAGVLSAWVAWSSYTRTSTGWMKPAILVVLGLLIAFYPKAGTAAIGLLLIVYFLMDGFASLLLGLELRPLPGWAWTLGNGLVSLVLALVFIGGWPFHSDWLVGLMVGISLLLDGVALLMLTTGRRPG